ncbi:adenylyl-sulfate kinase [Pseudomonas sp. NPDC090202]|uniref:adenylyl-sulfate kinase n=1 Tax=unclassified Pseudomonas TaxID=196821 RepID=UPI0038289973
MPNREMQAVPECTTARGAAILLTGLPAAGKSTVARALHRQLLRQGLHSMVVDGDVLRSGLSSDLGFSAEDRHENIRRASELARLLVDNGQVVILAMIAPQAEQRELFARRLGERYREVWCNAPLDICEQRDPKGHYARARRGELAGFTGVSAPYEVPQAPGLVLDTATQSVEACVDQLLGWLSACRLIA